MIALRWAALGLAIAAGVSVSLADDPDPAAVIRALEQATEKAVERAEPAVVSIGRLSDFATAPRLPGPFLRAAVDAPNWNEFFGAGVVLVSKADPAKRFVLTNRHVVVRHGAAKDEAESRLIVVLPGRRQVNAEIIAADPRSDLAVLRLDLAEEFVEPSEVRALEFGEAEAFRKGRLVLLLGNPYAVARDGSASASLATVANISRSPWHVTRRPLGEDDLTIHHLGTLWHLDSRINLGSSGGAVVDFQGRLVGLTTSLAALDGYESTVGYAIPMNAGFRRVVETLLQGLEVEYGFLGVAPRPSGRRMLLGNFDQTPSGAAEVLSVAAGSPADVAGIQPGDHVTAVNGEPVHGDDDLVREIGLLGPGAVARVDVVRPSAAGREPRTVEVRLGKWPVYDDTAIIATRQRREPWRGLSVDFPTARRRYITSDLFVRYPQGVVITQVQPGSRAAAADLKEGLFITRVNGKPTPTPAQFQEAIQGLSGDAIIRLDDDRELRLTE